MATPKKKHLIELMIEAGVKWPDGAEYAAQDKDSWLAFYTRKPCMESGKVTWSSYGGYVANSLKKLDSLCRNWHQTIVTREQYAEALADVPMTPAAQLEGKPGNEWVPVEWGDWKVGDMVRFDGFTNELHNHWSFEVGNEYAIGRQRAPISGKGEQPSCNHGFSFSRRKKPAAQLYSGVAGVMPSESIESLLAEIKAKREKHDALAAKADALALEISCIEQQINDKLNEYGFAMSQIAAASEPGQPVITDWRDLRIGDVVECVDYESDKKGVIVGIDREDEDQPIKVNRYMSGIAWPFSWHFIRRP